MKKTIFTAALVILIAVSASGCSDKGGTSDLTPSSNEGAGTLVNKAELINALWNDGSEEDADSISADAACLASSTFMVKKLFGFTIRANIDDSGDNLTASVVVSPINVSISDEALLMRGASCAGGNLSYIVTASEELPMDIEAMDDAAHSKPVDSAGQEAAPYAEGCDIIAHFEKQGGEGCEDADDADIANADDMDDGDGENDEVEDEPAKEEAECAEGSFTRSVKLVVDTVLCESIIQ